MSAGRSTIDPQSVSRLRDAARRLAAALDRARLYKAAAYASMAADSIRAGKSPPTEVEGGSRIPGLPRGRRVRNDDRGADVDLDFTLDEQGRAWMIREGDCYILGRAEAVCAEMRRFLADVAAGGDGYG